MDIAGLDHPEGLDGVSLLPLCRGETSGHPGYVFSEYHSNFTNTGIAMWRQGPWKYIRYAGYDPQLFDLDDDPEETHDLSRFPTRNRPGTWMPASNPSSTSTTPTPRPKPTTATTTKPGASPSPPRKSRKL